MLDHFIFILISRIRNKDICQVLAEGSMFLFCLYFKFYHNLLPLCAALLYFLSFSRHNNGQLILEYFHSSLARRIADNYRAALLLIADERSRSIYSAALVFLLLTLRAARLL